MTNLIMVADDSMFARMLIKEAVKQIYTDVDYNESTSGQQVLDKQASGINADWYLLDVNMGEPNGLETARELIERGVHANTITLVTGNKSSELEQKADDIQLNYINKAISPADVDAFVSRLKEFFDNGSGV